VPKIDFEIAFMVYASSEKGSVKIYPGKMIQNQNVPGNYSLNAKILQTTNQGPRHDKMNR